MKNELKIKKTMNFDLVNDDGCLMDSVQAHCLKDARDYFADKYTGNYTITWNFGQSKNVRLK